MKKLLSIICVIVICVSTLSTFAFAEAIAGDVSGDGVLDIVDVVFTRAYIIGTAQFTTEQFAIADMNGDKNVDVIDVVMMRKIIVDGGFNVDEDSDSDVIKDSDSNIEKDSDSNIDKDSDSNINKDSDSNIETDSDIIVDKSGITLSAQNLTLNKGASAVVYVETENKKKLMMNVKSDLFEAAWTSDDEKGLIGIAIFVMKNAENTETDATDKIDVYLEGNEDNAKSIIVTVTDKTEIDGYPNNYEVPDFGTYCGFPAVSFSADGNYYAYSVSELLTKYTEDELKDLYINFQAILEMFGFELKFIYNGTDGGDVYHFVNDTQTLSVDYGVIKLESGDENIVLAISKVG